MLHDGGGDMCRKVWSQRAAWSCERICIAVVSAASRVYELLELL